MISSSSHPSFQNDQELDGVEKEPLAGRGLASALRVAFQKGYVDGKLPAKVSETFNLSRADIFHEIVIIFHLIIGLFFNGVIV